MQYTEQELGVDPINKFANIKERLVFRKLNSIGE
jgi:hypothetical protein